MSERLAAVLRAEGGLIAGVVREDLDRGEGEPAARAAAGPRSAGRPEEIALVVEAVHEGSLLHYAAGRTVSQVDPDLALLAGDRLYALGLDRLARLGDLESVGVLADVIARCAQSYAAGAPAEAQAVWAAGAEAIGWGSPDETGHR
jgi:hypothetical protein